jgi:hypothetical protein
MEAVVSARDISDITKEEGIDAGRDYVADSAQTYRPMNGSGASADDGSLAYWHGEVDLKVSRPWTVYGTIPKIGVGLLSGQWGTYKTFIAIDLGVAVMSGTPIFGSDIDRRGGVLLYAAEGDAEVGIRVLAAINNRCPHYAEMAPFAWLTPEKLPLNLLDPRSVNGFIAHARKIAAEMQRRFRLPLAMILIDTVVATAGFARSGDEDDAAVVARLMKSGLSRIAQSTQTFVLGVDHFGKSPETGTRGSSAKEDNSDVVLAALGERSITGVVANPRLAVRKVRGGVAGREYAFTTRVAKTGLVDENQRPITTLVIDWSTQPSVSTSLKKDPWSKRSLRLLRRVLMTVIEDRGTDLCPFGNGPMVRAVDKETGRAEFYKAYPAEGGTPMQREGTRKRAFNRAIGDALATNLICVREIEDIQYVWFVRNEQPEARGKQ